MAIVRREQREEGTSGLGRALEWDPFRVMREMLRWDPYRELGRTLPRALFNPDFEVKERTDAFVLKADLPGLAEKDLDLSFTGNRLTISGQREEETLNEGETYYAAERSFGSFSRSFMLPDNTDPDHATADFKDGVLTVTVPKKAEEKAKKLTLGGGQKAKA
ncbi:MAG TPA: Hsp20/alpha crystallin family protein [Myxococcaceae bacterium]|jgi:HSP20 family protein